MKYRFDIFKYLKIIYNRPDKFKSRQCVYKLPDWVISSIDDGIESHMETFTDYISELLILADLIAYTGELNIRTLDDMAFGHEYSVWSSFRNLTHKENQIQQNILTDKWKSVRQFVFICIRGLYNNKFDFIKLAEYMKSIGLTDGDLIYLTGHSELNGRLITFTFNITLRWELADLLHYDFSIKVGENESLM